MTATLNEIPVSYYQVRVKAPQIAAFLDYLRWLATDEAARGTVVTAAQLWALYVEFVRTGVAPEVATEELGLPHWHGDHLS